MLKRSPILLVAVFFFSTISAQTLLPFLGKNGLTGLADTAGVVQIEPQFTRLDYIVRADAPYFYAQKDGQRVLVLRNGSYFADKGGGATTYITNYLDADKQKTELWTDLVAMDFPDKCVLLQTATNKKFECARLVQNGYQGWFPVDNHTYLGNSSSWNKARYGVIRVQKGANRFNFIDHSLEPIFKTDFAAGSVVDDEFFLLANDEKLVAIGDRKGNIRTKFQWQLLVPTDKKGYFISEPKYTGFQYRALETNEPPSPQLEGVPQAPPPPRAKTGLIDATGTYRIEPNLVDLQVADSNYLIFDDGKATGIVDYSGKVLFRSTEGQTGNQKPRLYAASKGRFLLQEQGKTTLISANGAQLLDSPFDKLYYEKEKHPDFPHFHFQKNDTCGLLTDDLKLIFQDNLGSIVSIRHGERLYFETNDSNKDLEQRKRGLVDASGRVLFPVEFKQFGFPYNIPFINVYKGTKRGLADLDGKMILDCVYEEIHFSLDDTRVDLYAKPVDHTNYLGFDMDGKRVPERDCLHPMNKKDEFAYQPPVQRGQPQAILFSDGKSAMLPSEWGDGRQAIYSINSPAGILVLKENDDHYLLFDTNLKPLLPKNCAMPRDLVNHRILEHVGLVPVFQYQTGVEPFKAQKTRPPSTFDSSQPNAASEVVVEATEGVLMDIAMVDNSELEPIGSGILNAKGEWVLPPKEGARYQPITYNLVLEFPLHTTKRDARFPEKMHRVNHPKPATWDIFSLEELDDYTLENTGLVWQRKPDETGKIIQRCTWFTRTGEQLAPFDFVSGPRKLTAQNLIAKEENGVRKWQILDEKLQKIADLPAFDEAPQFGQSLALGYFPAKIGGKYGILDSIGQIAVPFDYGKIEMFRNGLFFEEIQNYGTDTAAYILIDWQGKTIANSKRHIEERKSEDSGHVFYLLDANSPNERTLVFDKNGKQVFEVKNARFFAVEKTEGKHIFAKFQNTDKQYFFVDLSNGQDFRANE